MEAIADLLASAVPSPVHKLCLEAVSLLLDTKLGAEHFISMDAASSPYLYDDLDLEGEDTTFRSAIQVLCDFFF